MLRNLKRYYGAGDLHHHLQLFITFTFGWNPGDVLGYRLKVVYVCNGGKAIYTSKTIYVAFWRARGTRILFVLLLWACFLCDSAVATESNRSDLTLIVLQVSRSASITVNIANSSESPVKLWDETNSWGAAHWRVFIIRKGKVETFFQNPYRKFTVNVPSFKEIPSGSNVQRTLDLNGGNWCGRGLCAAFNEHGLGGINISFQAGDTVIVTYDVPATDDVQARKFGVWNGVVATLTTVD